MSAHDSRPKRGIELGHAEIGTLFVAAMLLIAACGPAVPTLEAVATTAVPAATTVPPTATTVAATETPLPTATPLAALPADGRVIYSEPAGGSPQTIIVRRPEGGDPPYPWVFVTTCLGCLPYVYDDFTDELLARGYATVTFLTGDFGEGEFCAWAWLEQNAAGYGLDMERALVFTHGVGLVGPVLGVADDSLWRELLSNCPNPEPATVHIRGVATYSAWCAVPAGTLADWAKLYAVVLNDLGVTRDLSEQAVTDLARLLQELPPSEWRTSDRLDDTMRLVAHRTPLYYIHGPKPADQMPAFLLIHGGQMETDPNYGEPPTEESELMAGALEQAGLSVETLWLPEARFYDIQLADTGVPAETAEAIDTWAQGLFVED
ncbi:MAG: hypothetical protein MUF84_09465 [Anaerolineae bacterium]|jgi:hypothetical protein|nr:hypothetical protein [Anaerolineae bacterium]